MRLLLNLVYWLLWLALAPRMVWHWLRGRPLPEARIGRVLGLVALRTSQRPCLWLHGESLGEVNVLLTLLPHLEARLAGWDIVVATGTTSGHALASKRIERHRVLLCPIDLPLAAEKVLDRIRPDAMVVVENARQPHLIAAARARAIPRTLVNGRVLSRHETGGLPALAQRQMLQNFSSILAQTPEDTERFAACGVTPARVRVGGAVKFHNVQTDRRNPRSRQLAELAGIGEDDIVWLAGSTRKGEERIVARVFATLACQFPRLKLIVVPRHARRFNHVCRVLARHEIVCQRRTALETSGPNPAARALVVDVFGELPAWWGTAHIGFVGNSLTQHGGQNMIEPAAYGVATCFGPHTENFQDVVSLLLRAGGAEVVESEDELRSFVRRCLAEPHFAEQLGRCGQTAVARQSGALENTLAHLDDFFARLARPDCRTLTHIKTRTQAALRAA